MTNPLYRIQYIRDCNKNPVITIAWRILPHNSPAGGAVIEYAWAKKNPADQFNKAMGRNIALGRLFCDSSSETLPRRRVTIVPKEGKSLPVTVALFLEEQFAAEVS